MLQILAVITGTCLKLYVENPQMHFADYKNSYFDKLRQSPTLVEVAQAIGNGFSAAAKHLDLLVNFKFGKAWLKDMNSADHKPA